MNSGRSEAKRPVIIVVPFVNAELSDDAEISLAHLQRHLFSHPRTLLCPEGLTVPLQHPLLDGFEVAWFPREHFDSLRAYSQLLVSPELYERFDRFEHMLVYQLDSLVFSDQLDRWCDQEQYDYIGAPWVIPNGRNGRTFGRVGNGGFSLRRVSVFLEISRRVREPSWLEAKLPPPWRARLRDWADEVTRRLVPRWNRLAPSSLHIRPTRASYFDNEDVFWSFVAPRLFPSMRIPPPEVAVSFSFDMEPRYCFTQTHGELPFGCHGWCRTDERYYDRAFWKPFLITG